MKTLHDHNREPQFNLKPIQEVLGDATPDITPTQLGKFRLVVALQKRFGPDYKNVLQAKKLLDYFEKEHAFFQHYRKLTRKHG